MAMQSFYVVQPYMKRGKRFVSAPAFEVANQGQALRRIESIVSGKIVGAVAFMQPCDPEANEYGEIEIIGKCGEIPPEAEEED